MEIPEGYANCSYRFTLDGVVDEMSFGVGVDLTIGLTPSEIAEACADAYIFAVIGESNPMHGSWTFVGTRVTKTIGGEPVLGEFNVNLVGTGSANTVPCNSALLVKKLTAGGGRSNRGRMFVPPHQLDELGVNNAGVISSSFVSANQARYSNFHAGLVADGVSPVLLHSDPAATPTGITAFAVQSLLATQRRRMR